MTAIPQQSATAASDKRAVGLVCTAHFFSHFNMMLLPPLFPVLHLWLGVSYTSIGFALSLYSLVSGLTQAPMGFLVDRFGAPYILITGLALEGIAFALIGVAPVYSAFLILLGIAGIANSVYHPADYSILNNVVTPERMGRAFSYHTAAGLLGEAAAPACVLLAASLIGWQLGLVVFGSSCAMVAFCLWLNLHNLVPAKRPGRPATIQRSSHLLFSAPLIMGLLFFVGISLVSRGITGFGVTALHVEYSLSLGMAGTVLSAWLIAAPVGVLAGGRLADKSSEHTRIIAGCFVMIAICIASIPLLAPNVWLISAAFAVGGFFAGVVSPSRDMLIRSITPAGQSGKVFGFVSTGFNIGGMLAPPVYGYLLDQQLGNGVFWLASLASLLTIATVLNTRRFIATRKTPE